MYRAFHDSCKELAEKDKGKQIAAQGKYDICDLAWKEIIKLVHIIAQILKQEATCHPDIGLCEFANKRLEMWKLAVHCFMLGARGAEVL